VRLEHEYDCEADGATTDDDGHLALADVGALDGVPADGHGLGQRGTVGGQTVGDAQREGLLDDELFGVGAGRSDREPDRVDVLAALHQRHRDDGCADGRCLAGAEAVVEDLAQNSCPYTTDCCERMKSGYPDSAITSASSSA
jgi:hypothetical protein